MKPPGPIRSPKPGVGSGAAFGAGFGAGAAPITAPASALVLNSYSPRPSAIHAVSRLRLFANCNAPFSSVTRKLTVPAVGSRTLVHSEVFAREVCRLTTILRDNRPGHTSEHGRTRLQSIWVGYFREWKGSCILKSLNAYDCMACRADWAMPGPSAMAIVGTSATVNLLGGGGYPQITGIHTSRRFPDHRSGKGKALGALAEGFCHQSVLVVALPNTERRRDAHVARGFNVGSPHPQLRG